jgi:hypothetical protein
MSRQFDAGTNIIQITNQDFPALFPQPNAILCTISPRLDIQTVPAPVLIINKLQKSRRSLASPLLDLLQQIIDSPTFLREKKKDPMMYILGRTFCTRLAFTHITICD